MFNNNELIITKVVVSRVAIVLGSSCPGWRWPQVAIVRVTVTIVQKRIAVT